MGMKRHSSRVIPAALVAALALAACGSDNPAASNSTTGDSVPSVGNGLLAPRPISVTSGGGGGGGTAAAESDRVAADSAIMPYYIANYVAGPGMPALPTNDVGYVYQAGATITAEQVAALAATFGVTGEPVRIDEGYGVQWRVGPEDGTGPALWLSQDAQLSWNYNGPWAVEGARRVRRRIDGHRGPRRADGRGGRHSVGHRRRRRTARHDHVRRAPASGRRADQGRR